MSHGRLIIRYLVGATFAGYDEAMPSIYFLSLLNRSTIAYVVAAIATLATSAGSFASAIRPHG